ncbi:MAG TPA: ATP synthase F1 subunit gamma [Myxococcales bacterium]|jgi:F-type H+-transporting ATPase subunit gamma|nr:ATP synthase F1 subunit gamma [Myxococcales bacterium]
MASQRAIRTRIKSVRNTQKITKALKLVSAAKLRRAQDAVVRTRPYAQALDELLGSLARARAEAEIPPHPLMEVRETRRIEVVLLTSDRGLCGGFNSNIIRRAQRFLVEEGDKYDAIQFSTIGRRGRDFAKRRGIETRKDYVGFFGKLRYAMAKEVADDLIVEYRERKLDAVYLLYNQFKSAMTQSITLSQLLPIVAPAEQQQAPGKGGFITPEHIYEPSRPQLLEHLIPRQLAMQMWRALLESEASEHGARMTAMDSATNNANDMIGRLSLEYNRARQASITKELMEIVSGAEALK